MPVKATKKPVLKIPGGTRSKVDSTGVFYENCVCSFIDIMGFKALLKGRTAGEVHAIIQLFQRHSAPDEDKIRSMDEARMQSRAWAQSVSDAIVRARTFDTSWADGAFVHELLDLVHIQIELVNRGVLIRGGTTIGQACVGIDGEHTIFGPGLARAYEIESQEACFPRIVIDDEAFEQHRTNPALRQEGNSAQDELKVINKLVTVGEDGTRFIDYLSAQSEFDSEGHYLEFLQRHADLIRKGRKEGGDLRKRRKFEWLARYHNSRVIPMRDATLKDPKRKAAFFEEYEVDAKDYFDDVVIKGV